MIKGLVVNSAPLPTCLAGRTVTLDLQSPCLVGILNVTPDSFSDGGCFLAVEAALERGRSLADDGAALIDIGGESTRPGAPGVTVQEELDRVIPVVEALRRDVPRPISIDTTKSAVAAAAIAAGADFVNDISGLTFDPEMAGVVARSGAGLIAMHTRGRPVAMQRDTFYADVVAEVKASLQWSLDLACAAGVPREKIAVDPGIGFGKDVQGNLELLRRLPELLALGQPLLIGTSRKSFVGRVLGQDDPADRLVGTLATVALGYAGGARLFRVHDVKAAREAALMADAVCKGAGWPG